MKGIDAQTAEMRSGITKFVENKVEKNNFFNNFMILQFYDFFILLFTKNNKI
jgi:hypothetical protein